MERSVFVRILHFIIQLPKEAHQMLSLREELTSYEDPDFEGQRVFPTSTSSCPKAADLHRDQRILSPWEFFGGEWRVRSAWWDWGFVRFPHAYQHLTAVIRTAFDSSESASHREELLLVHHTCDCSPGCVVATRAPKKRVSPGFLCESA